jgi:hypothetical protein
MARPRKNNADYFSHDANARHDLKIKALEAEMGVLGYALYFKFLEFLAGSDFYEIDQSKPYIKVSLPVDLGCTKDEFDEFLNHAINLELLTKENDKIFSTGLKKRLSVLDRIRDSDRKRKKNDELDGPDDIKNSPSGKYLENSRNTPSKEKETKEEEKKRDLSKEYQTMTKDEMKIMLMEMGISRGDVDDLLDQYGKDGMIDKLLQFDRHIKNKESYTPEQKLQYLTNLIKNRKK